MHCECTSLASKPDVKKHAFIQNSQDIFTVQDDLTNSLLEYLYCDLTYEKLLTQSLSETHTPYTVKHELKFMLPHSLDASDAKLEATGFSNSILQNRMRADSSYSQTPQPLIAIQLSTCNFINAKQEVHA